MKMNIVSNRFSVFDVIYNVEGSFLLKWILPHKNATPTPTPQKKKQQKINKKKQAS